MKSIISVGWLYLIEGNVASSRRVGRCNPKRICIARCFCSLNKAIDLQVSRPCMAKRPWRGEIDWIEKVGIGLISDRERAKHNLCLGKV